MKNTKNEESVELNEKKQRKSKQRVSEAGDDRQNTTLRQ